MNDPCQWSVDQVVGALCSPNAAFRTSADPGQRPDPNFLEAKLREQYIDGTTLLTDIDLKSLREDIGIQPLGPRSTILREIKRLRRQSRTYGDLRRQSLSDETSFASEDIGHPIWSRTTPSDSRNHSTAVLADDVQSFMKSHPKSPKARPICPDNLTTPYHGVSDQTLFTQEDNGQGCKSPKSSTLLAQDVQQEPAALGSSPLDGMPEGAPVLGPSDETHIVDETGKERRRLVLKEANTVIGQKSLADETSLGQPTDLTFPVTEDKSHIASTEISTEPQYIADADMDAETHDNLGTDDSRSVVGTIQGDLAQPGSNGIQTPRSVTVDEKGRKRIVSMLISHSQQSPTMYDAESPSTLGKESFPALDRVDLDPHNTYSNGRSSTRRPDQVYLGFKALPVDSIFYGDNSKQESPGKKSDSDDDSNEFTFSTSGRFSNGQRRYVYSRLGYFYKSTIQSLSNRDQNIVEQMPYPSNVARKHRSLFMTTFKKTSEGIIASKKHRPGDLARTSDTSKLTGPEENAFATKHAANANDTDWDYLEKWDRADEVNTVLPAYGDSGSEGQYDLETWREMEAEQGSKIERPLYRSRRKKLETRQVISVVDREVENLIDRWKSKRSDSLCRNAWRLWTKSRREKTITLKVERFNARVMSLDKRLDKMRQEILNEVWTSVKAISKQCQILEPTIFEREELKWKISVLQQPRAPEKPTKPKKPNTIDRSEPGPFSANDEGVQTQQSSRENSEDSLGSFVISDDDDNLEITNIQGPFLDTDSEEQRTPAQGQHTTTPESGFKCEKTDPFLPLPESISTGNHDIIDLTLCSSGGETQINAKIRTPPPFHFASDDDPFARSEKKRKAFKVPPSTTKPVVVINTDSGSAYKPEPVSHQLPELHEIGKILRMNPKLLEERQDRKRLLLYHLAKVSDAKRKATFECLEKPLQEAKAEVWDAFRNIIAHRYRIRGMTDKESAAVMLLAGLYVSWTVPTILRPMKGMRRTDIDTAAADEEGFEDFFNFLCECKTPRYFDNLPAAEGDLGSSNSELESDPFSNRRKPVPKNQEASQHREKAQRRVKDLDRHQAHLKKRLQAMGRNDDDASSVFVNSGVLDDDLIYLNPLIGARIQPHQKDGVRFIWREIIQDPSNEGCLLAQTMGLGKTMQVISFLVTLAEAAKSANEKIRRQIPERLRDSRALVLCPPALVENWFEEFLMWAPQPMTENIGHIWKINANTTLDERIEYLDEWSDSDRGGILVLGYSLFRDLLKNLNSRLDEDQHGKVTEAILKRPEIVVADEAHVMKNMENEAYQFLQQIRTRSRIALTGSPLSNKLSEYYALIEWVAPGYLGSQTEFHQHYEKPIKEGLYVDSLPLTWRSALKRLELFKREVQPKVHRADLSALALKGKSEFIIKLPLTALQTQLYRAFAEAITHRYGKTEAASTDLLGWVSVLRLLCNHPECFRVKMIQRLNKKPEEIKQTSVIKGLKVSDGDKDATKIAPDVASSTYEKLLAPFQDVADVASVALAYKMVALRHIVDYSLRAGDKVLVFSHSILTLDYVQKILREFDDRLQRIDGTTKTAQRQSLTKEFNQGNAMVLLVSTRAGGTGLNLFGANRVVILDDDFNPMWEEQAIGRAYRIGQQKHVFVYRLTVGGTFEEVLHNQSLFKRQLATRVVDQKNPMRKATKILQDYFRPPKDVPLEDLEPLVGKDIVLDKILAIQGEDRFVCSIVPCETFNLEDDDLLTAEEQKEVEQEEAKKQNQRKKLANSSATNKQNDPRSTEPVGIVMPAPQPPATDQVATTSPLKTLPSATQAERKNIADNPPSTMLPVLEGRTRMGTRVSSSPEPSFLNDLVPSRVESEPVQPVTQAKKPSEMARREKSIGVVDEVARRGGAYSRGSPPIVGKDNSERIPGLVEPKLPTKPQLKLDEAVDQNATSSVNGKVRKADNLSDFPELQGLLDREAKRPRLR
ncbi:MAG: hypothetical protein LQ351_003722 [Letrouitia transgressa]|nr:MAG: hypothetical protein LQ351_003722 [Letrouitia transgressa]